eukprot:149609_1
MTQNINIHKPSVWDPITIRGVTFQNRIGVAPMCMYSSTDGFIDLNFHSQHIFSRIQGMGLFIIEASGIESIGRISPKCVGIYKDEHIKYLKQLVDYVHKTSNCKIGIQLAHAGRKGSTAPPYNYYKQYNVKYPMTKLMKTIHNDGWKTVSPNTLSLDEINKLINVTYPNAVKRAITAGFDFIELHMAHGYLVHEFYSLVCNKRTDKYGGKSLENRCRFAIDIVKSVRKYFNGPLFVRISCDDYLLNDKKYNNIAWNFEKGDCEYLVRNLLNNGVDVIDCSGGGIFDRAYFNTKKTKLYQLGFAQKLKQKVFGCKIAAVGGIRYYKEAANIIENEIADFVLIGRQCLREPYIALKWQKEANRFTDYMKQYGYATQWKLHSGLPSEIIKRKNKLNSKL